MRGMLLKAFLLLVILGVTCLPAQSKKTPGELYTEAQKAYKVKDYKRFLNLYRELERLRPYNRVVMYNLSVAYSLNKDQKNTLLSLKKTLPLYASEKIVADPYFKWLQPLPEFKAVVAAAEALRRPVLNSRTAFVIKQRDVHPESIAFDPKAGCFYIGSVHHRKILRRDKKGELQDFVTTGKDGLDAVMGLKIDSKRRLLWITTVAIPHMTGYKPEYKGRTAIVGFNLETGQCVGKKVLRQEGNHMLGDLAIHPNGDVYATDSSANIVYRYHPPTGKLEAIIASDSFYSLQGLDFSPDGNYLFIEEYGSGVYVVDTIEKKILWKIEHSMEAPLVGIDGLYFYNNSLVGIQNGVTPMRVSQFFLDKEFKKVERVRILERDNPHFDEPTLGVLVDDHLFYIANSQWKRYEKDGTIFPNQKLEDILILEVSLAE